MAGDWDVTVLVDSDNAEALGRDAPKGGNSNALGGDETARFLETGSQYCELVLSRERALSSYILYRVVFVTDWLLGVVVCANREEDITDMKLGAVTERDLVPVGSLEM